VVNPAGKLRTGSANDRSTASTGVHHPKEEGGRYLDADERGIA